MFEICDESYPIERVDRLNVFIKLIVIEVFSINNFGTNPLCSRNDRPVPI